MASDAPDTPDARALPPAGAALLLGLVAALLVFQLGAPALLGPDEPRYARVAVEMHRSGDWVTPTLQGQPWLEKPALYYWLASASDALLGETETAARLPSVLAGLLLVGATALFGARLFGASAGLHAGFVAGTSLLVFAYSRAAAMDMLLASTLTVAIGLFALRVLGIAGSLSVVVAYGFLALATLAKGPLGVLLPGLVLVGFLLWTREWRLLRTLLSPIGVAFFLLIAAPWYLAIYLAQGEAFVNVFLLNHNLQRFTSTVHNHPGNVLYYLPVLLAGFFPWSGFVLPALVPERRSRPDVFLFAWLLLPLGFFSLAGSKLPGYILPCVPPLAILIGRTLDRLVREECSRLLPRFAALVGLAAATLVATTPFLLWRQGEPGWLTTAPLAAWSLLVGFGFSRRVALDPQGAVRLLRVGAAGILVLVSMSAPPILSRLQSGRALFIPAQGRDVLAFGAWRTYWMAGYFYNDGRVREITDLLAVTQAAASGPTLVLCGRSQRRQLEALPGFRTQVLAEAARGDALVRLAPR